MDANKQKALDLALGQIEKAFGKEAICKLGSGSVQKVEAIPTGALSLDLALGVGGLPRGRVIEIYGPEAGGKTTLSLHVAAQTQKLGGTGTLLIGDIIEQQFQLGETSLHVGASLSFVLMILIFVCLTVMNRFSDSDGSVLV